MNVVETKLAARIEIEGATENIVAITGKLMTLLRSDNAEDCLDGILRSVWQIQDEAQKILREVAPVWFSTSFAASGGYPGAARRTSIYRDESIGKVFRSPKRRTRQRAAHHARRLKRK